MRNLPSLERWASFFLSLLFLKLPIKFPAQQNAVEHAGASRHQRTDALRGRERGERLRLGEKLSPKGLDLLVVAADVVEQEVFAVADLVERPIGCCAFACCFHSDYFSINRLARNLTTGRSIHFSRKRMKSIRTTK